MNNTETGLNIVVILELVRNTKEEEVHGCPSVKTFVTILPVEDHRLRFDHQLVVHRALTIVAVDRDLSVHRNALDVDHHASGRVIELDQHERRKVVLLVGEREVLRREALSRPVLDLAELLFVRRVLAFALDRDLAFARVQLTVSHPRFDRDALRVSSNAVLDVVQASVRARLPVVHAVQLDQNARRAGIVAEVRTARVTR